MRISDWSSDVFSSDLLTGAFGHLAGNGPLTIGGIEVVATDADGDHTTAHVAVEVVDAVPTADLSANGATKHAEDASGQLSRLEDTRGGKAVVSTWRSRWSAHTEKKQQIRSLIA